MAQDTSSSNHDHGRATSSAPGSFWFDDGSVIITVAQERFKLHKSLVNRHSTLLPLLPASGIDDEHVPHVEIPSNLTNVKDFMALLGHIYHDAPLDREPLSSVSSILRVSSDKSLQFPTIHSLAKARFCRLLEPGPGVANFTTPDDLEEVLGLAVEHDISSVQKALYYNVATTSHFEPGTPHPSLPPVVTARCAALQDALIAHFTPILFTVATAGHMACTDVFAETWMPDVIAPALANNGLCHPIETLREIQAVRWEDKGICDECCQQKRAEWDEEVRVVWDKVDTWLSL
ncbi:hypothetical protein PHLGIDRAFT_80106 [Phlebiopsis gigantea 11061_1 CR5-6]|uniref:BTB domain-containing protein n=1 Tax=Phlebiopsis gigantea (strain 11061_1 CR5-6) TaxID=745531 RepID=A0A0C3PAE7_PHLG1|nr:hypothetical protein PHLGIDRAFT_80106 [Phlebiopsis gigantea 11061_1 CR5-6]